MTRIEVFADVWCPFAHVGLRRLVERRLELGRDDVALGLRAWPLELVNGRPLDVAVLGKEIDALRRGPAPELFAGFDPDHFPGTSLPALALTAAAYRMGDDVGERVGLALRHALFEEGRDISEAAVLDAVAVDHGVGPVTDDDRAAITRDWDEGRRRGVVGSPHFVLPDGDFFCPALDIHKVDGQFLVTADREHFEAFVDQAFGS